MSKFNYDKLFLRCLRISYNHTSLDGSWAIETEGDTLYLYLQRSLGKNDWKNNFDFPARPYKGMDIPWKAHRGFLRVWKSIEPEITEKILDTNYRQIVIVGYSHGASLAVFAHEYVWYHRPDIRDNIFGFGFDGSRVFYGRLPDELAKRWENFMMIRNGNDLVTHLPPAVLGYKHVGQLKCINQEQIYPNQEPFPFGMRLGCVMAHYPDNILYALRHKGDNLDD